MFTTTCSANFYGIFGINKFNSYDSGTTLVEIIALFDINKLVWKSQAASIISLLVRLCKFRKEKNVESWFHS